MILLIVDIIMIFLMGYFLSKLIQYSRVRKIISKTHDLIDEGKLECDLLRKSDDTDTPEQKKENLNKLVESRGKLGIIEGRIDVIDELWG